MLNVLIITYYYPPCNGVQGWRPYSWFNYFPQKNIHTTVLTRHWLGNETVWNDSIKENLQEMTVVENVDSRLIRLPYKHSSLQKLAEIPFFKIRIISKLLFLFYKLTGNFSPEVDAFRAFKDYASSYIRKNKVDLIIISAPPHNLVRLGHDLYKKHRIPFIIDFRDLWDNDELKKDYNPTLQTRVNNRISKFYLKRWLKNARLVTTVSPPLIRKIQQLCTKEIIEITNGFEKELFSSMQVTSDHEHFTISIIGSIYEKQDISIIIEGLKHFISLADKHKVKLNFIGIKSIASVAERIRKALPEECIFLSDRLPRETAIRYTLQSHVLLYAGWKNYDGIYSGKIFDYIGARRNILIAPGDDNVIDNIVLNTQSGKIANTVNEFTAALTEWYAEWKRSGQVAYKGKEDHIDYYTRENQAKIFAEYILGIASTLNMQK